MTKNELNIQNSPSLNELINLFAKFGLSSDAARIYQICYFYPQTTVAKISELTGINRTTLYPQIQKLIEMEIISKVENGWKNYLVAKELDFVLTDLNSKITQTIKNLKEEKVEIIGDKTKLVLYSDVSSVKECYYNILRHIEQTDFYYINGNIVDWYNLDKPFFRKFITERDSICKEKN